MTTEYKISKTIINKISQYCVNIDNIQIIDTNNSENIINSDNYSNIIINLGIVNNIRRINKFHKSVNNNLSIGDIYICCGETLLERKQRKFQKAWIGFKNIFFFIDFLYKRVIPKLPIMKLIYFSITKGHNRVMSKTEILGRIISCGFNVLEYFEHNDLLYVISKKTDNPKSNIKGSYGLLFKMNRVGYRGEIVGFYKFRTMYPYAEYCQELIHNENKLSETGKFKNDFRITYWGRFLRKLWIDELPMLINFLKGDLNLVGVRPLSEGYFLKYPKTLQDLRIQNKPGLIPPYYADLPKNFEEILESEKKYIKEKMDAPISTDIKYFFKVFWNIVFRGARSN